MRKKKLFYIEFGEVGITLAGLPSSSKLGLSWVWAGRVPRAPMQVIEIFFFFEWDRSWSLAYILYGIA